LGKRLGSNIDERVVAAVVKAAHLDHQQIEDGDIDEAIQSIGEWLQLHHPSMGHPQFKHLAPRERDGRHEPATLEIKSRLAGVTRTTRINDRMLGGSDYVLLKKRIAEIESVLGQGPYQVIRDSHEHEAIDFEAILDRVFEFGSKGVQLQRFKGLGEMNPEQLWETTMDTTKRTMLKVEVTDAVEADATFTVLMGDAVEPRRDFIVSRALDVRNLDV
jgi:DNA gyrase subunit B